MRHSSLFRLILSLALTATFFVGCSRDPNVRKQKYLESGQRYFDKGKYREASIQFSNAIQVDAHYADAHYQLAQTYLKLQDWPRAYQELVRTVELQPENYKAHIDLANLLTAGHDLKQAQEHTGVFLRLFEIMSGGQQICQVDVSLIIFGLQFNSADEFLVGSRPILKLEIGLGKLIMSVGVMGVHLDGVTELNGRFAILALVKIALSAFQVFLLTHVGIAGTSNKECSGQGQTQDQAKKRRMPHSISPNAVRPRRPYLHL